MRGGRKRAAIALFTLVSMLLSIGVAYGYNDGGYNMPCWWYNPSSGNLTVNWRWGSINQSGEWASAFLNANNLWNTATINGGSKVRLGFSSSAQANVNTYYANEGRGGYTSMGCHLYPWTTAWFSSYGNLFWAADTGGWSMYRQFVSTHELGHGLSLGHSLNGGAVMYNAYQGFAAPGTDDINGLKAMYP